MSQFDQAHSAAASVTRRGALRLMTVGGMAALLAACAPAPAAPTAPGATAAPAATPVPTATAVAAASGAQPTPQSASAAQPTAAAAAAQPKQGGQLISTALPLARVDAHCFCGGDALLGIWDTLIGYDDKYQPTPNLVQSWEPNTDLTQVTLTLRQGIQFHSGREFT